MGVGFKFKVLILNRLWQPVNIIGVERAFSLLTQEHAQVIHTADESFRLMDSASWLFHSSEEIQGHDESFIHTVRMRIRVPKVMLLRKYDKLPVQEVKFNRANVFERDDHRCQYCGQTFKPSDLNMDHVIPREQGGKTSWQNIVTSCIECNSRKANRLPHQAGMHLLRKPERPKWRPFVSSLIGQNYDSDWDHFIRIKKPA